MGWGSQSLIKYMVRYNIGLEKVCFASQSILLGSLTNIKQWFSTLRQGNVGGGGTRMFVVACLRAASGRIGIHNH